MMRTKRTRISWLVRLRSTSPRRRAAIVRRRAEVARLATPEAFWQTRIAVWPSPPEHWWQRQFFRGGHLKTGSPRRVLCCDSPAASRTGHRVYRCSCRLHVVLARRPSAARRGLWPWIEQSHLRASLRSSRSPFPGKSDFRVQRQNGHNSVETECENPETKSTGREGANTWVFGAAPGKSPPCGTRTKDPDGFIDGARRDRRAIVAEAVREWRAVDTNTANIKRGSPWETATSRASRLSSQRTPRRRDVLLATRSANPYRELAALLQPYQTARARGSRRSLCADRRRFCRGHRGASSPLRKKSV
jgi:hypothetical protein